MSDETKEPLNVYTAPRDLRTLVEQTPHTLRSLAHELGILNTPEHMVAWHRANTEGRGQVVLDSLALWDKAHPGEYRGPTVTTGPQPQHTNTQPQSNEIHANMNQPPSNFGPPQQQPQFTPQPQNGYAPQQPQFAPPPPPQFTPQQAAPQFTSQQAAPQFTPQQAAPQFTPQQAAPQFAPQPPQQQFAPPPAQPQFAPQQPPAQQYAQPQQPQFAPPPQQPQYAPPAPPQQPQFTPPQIVTGPVPGAPVPVQQQPLFQPQPPPQPSTVDPAAQSFAQGATAPALPEAPKATRGKRSPAPAPAGGDADLGASVLQNLANLSAANQALQDRLEKLEYLCVLSLSGHVQQLSNLLQRTPQDVLAILMNDAGALKSFLTSMTPPKG